MNLFADQKQTVETGKFLVTKGERLGERGGLGFLDWHTHTEVYGMTGQWGPAV